MARNVCCRTRNQKVTLTPRPCMATVRILSHSDVTETFSYLSRQTSSRENMGTIQKSLFAVSLKPEKIISFALHRSGRKNRNFRAVHSTWILTKKNPTRMKTPFQGITLKAESAWIKIFLLNFYIKIYRKICFLCGRALVFSLARMVPLPEMHFSAPNRPPPSPSPVYSVKEKVTSVT